MPEKIAILTSSFGVAGPGLIERIRAKGYEVIPNPYGRKLEREEVVRLAEDARGVIAGLEDWSSATIDRLPRLKVISRVGIGLENVDLSHAASRGIAVTNTPDAVTPAVAELTVGLILSLLRGIHSAHGSISQGGWKREMGSLLSQKTVGLVGFGRIGRAVATLLSGFSVRVRFVDPVSSVPFSGAQRVSMEELLSMSDIVSLHCPPTGETPLLGAAQLGRMKKGAFLVNTARAELVDETALQAALDSGALAGAALDVFWKEPYTGPLARHPKVLLTAHIGSYAKEARAAMEDEAVANLLKALGA